MRPGAGSRALRVLCVGRKYVRKGPGLRAAAETSGWRQEQA